MRTVSTRSLEVQNGWSAAMVGLFLMLPVETFSTASGYTVFLKSGLPEPFWGALFLVLGVLQLVAAFQNRVIPRRIAASLLACLFGVYVAAIAVGNPASAAIPFVLPMVVGQVWAFYRARVVA